MTGPSLAEGSASDDPKGADPQDVWAIFQTAPARLVHPRHVVHAYDETISIEAAARLQQSDRVQRPLARLVREKYRLPDAGSCPEPAEGDLELLSLPPERVEQHSRLAGVVFWSHVLAGEIRNREVAEMKSRIGDLAFQLALHNRDLAAGHPPPGDLDLLMQAIETDGRKCWGSWQASLPEPLAAWLRLRDETDDHSAFSAPADAERGAAILRRLAQDKTIDAAAREIG
ncbi:putative type III secretion component (plasmid) [Sinorhizobium fredii NGR234]|uniref:Type III secretion component n=1 Tax=Sinorhizobium fredii (strain NBRC 101917 / NGR234) TaxID=394 RepID=C3KNA8_SINFN|nr:type III secretion protein [Sinorhizobium fredii]ACP23738.1 putative type III secretion component [Sinorhizobium fredii NGR234]